MEAQDATHVCTDCGKGFNSGRALGGHWRTHVTERRRAAAESDVVSPANPELPESDVASSSRSPEKPELSAPCRVCKKSFPTEKALAGHMRCHPEREWRGINPPPESPSSSGEVRDFPASWGRKGSRSQLSSDVAIAVKALLELSQREITRVSGKKRSSGESKPPTKAITEVSTESMYKCSECERSFSTFQALGGHRSTHNKDLHKNKKMKIKKSDSNGKIQLPVLKIKSEEEPQVLIESCSKSTDKTVESTDKTVESTPESPSGMPEGAEVQAPLLSFGFDLNELPCDDMAVDN